MKYVSGTVMQIALVSALFAVAPQSRAFTLDGWFLLGSQSASSSTTAQTGLLDFNLWKLQAIARIWEEGIGKVSRSKFCSRVDSSPFMCRETASFSALRNWKEYCGNGTGLSFTSPITEPPEQVVHVENWGLNGLGYLTLCDTYMSDPGGISPPTFP